jgi:succinoglycan biosynthesis transport protein ExoP
MPESQFIHELRQYLSVLHKRRALILTCLTVSFVTAFLYNYTTRPLYQASVQIFIEKKTPDVLPGREIVAEPVGDLQTEFQLLQGRALAEKAVERMNLQKHEEFQTGPLMSPWERFQRKFLGRNPIVVDAEGIPLSPAVEAFRSRVSVQPLPGNKLLNIRFTAYNADFAATAANTLAELYIQQALDFRFNATSEATGWLSERLSEQQAKVEKAERALLEFGGREGRFVEQMAELEKKVAALNEAILTARTERIAKEALLAQAQRLGPNELQNLPYFSARSQASTLRSQVADLQREQARLSETLGDRHPDMLRLRDQVRAAEDKLRSEMSIAVRSLEAEVQAARQQEAALQANLESVRRESQDFGRKSIDYGILKREVDTNQQLFQTLMTRAKETGLETKLNYANVRIVEKAQRPRSPISPDKRRNYEMGLLVGLGLGLAISFLFEYLDNTFKTPDDVKEHLGVPFLGMVPDGSSSLKGAPGARKGAPVAAHSPTMLRSPKSAVAEAYRVIRTNLIFSSADRTGRVLIFTSANPSEGKTTTVANVAASLAINGSRVLAVDADLRRPTMHQHFNVMKSPGLSDLIVGKARPSDVIQKTQFGGLQILTCGYVPPNPTELLGSSSLREILGALRTHYDWVLIDTPPVLAMADTSVLSPLADGVVIVVGAESSNRPAVQRAVEQIRSVNGRLLGAILNRVNFERNSYYYGQYYGEYYRSYYAEEKEVRRPKAVPASRGRNA